MTEHNVSRWRNNTSRISSLPHLHSHAFSMELLLCPQLIRFLLFPSMLCALFRMAIKMHGDSANAPVMWPWLASTTYNYQANPRNALSLLSLPVAWLVVINLNQMWEQSEHQTVQDSTARSGQLDCMGRIRLLTSTLPTHDQFHLSQIGKPIWITTTMDRFHCVEPSSALTMFYLGSIKRNQSAICW